MHSTGRPRAASPPRGSSAASSTPGPLCTPLASGSLAASACQRLGLAQAGGVRVREDCQWNRSIWTASGAIRGTVRRAARGSPEAARLPRPAQQTPRPCCRTRPECAGAGVFGPRIGRDAYTYCCCRFVECASLSNWKRSARLLFKVLALLPQYLPDVEFRADPVEGSRKQARKPTLGEGCQSRNRGRCSV